MMGICPIAKYQTHHASSVIMYMPDDRRKFANMSTAAPLLGVQVRAGIQRRAHGRGTQGGGRLGGAKPGGGPLYCSSRDGVRQAIPQPRRRRLLSPAGAAAQTPPAVATPGSVDRGPCREHVPTEPTVYFCQSLLAQSASHLTAEREHCEEYQNLQLAPSSLRQGLAVMAEKVQRAKQPRRQRRLCRGNLPMNT